MLNFPRWKVISIIAICLLFCLLALPNVLPASVRDKATWLPTSTVNLGLDLRGGSHLLLELKYDNYFNDQMANIVDEVRSRLRKDNIGYLNLQHTSDKVTFTLRDESADVNIKSLVRDIENGLEATDTGNGAYEIAYSEQAIKERRAQLLEQSIEIVSRRIDETGTREPTIQRQGDTRILVQVPGLENPEKLKELLGKTANMTFHLVDTTVPMGEAMEGSAPPGVLVLPSDGHETMSDGRPMKYAVQKRVLLSGDMLVAAHATFEMGEPVISFTFNATGAKKFAQVTADNVGRPFAIVLDGKVITAPVIRSPILGGNGIISGHFTTESAQNLALLLRAGALPVPLTVIEERTVGPSLGSDSIADGKNASMLGVAMVMAFMLICYGLFGLFANIALIMNLIMIIAALSLFQATLTLPGIAGIVLTLGMAVDANVLIYERIREEARNGKSPFAAIDSGFRAAFGTIIDSHVTTLMAAIVLYSFGSGSIKGFAVTMIIGIILSLFSAVTLTRLMVVLWLKRVRPKTIPL